MERSDTASNTTDTMIMPKKMMNGRNDTHRPV